MLRNNLSGVTDSKKGGALRLKKGHCEFTQILSITKPFILYGCFKKSDYGRNQKSEIRVYNLECSLNSVAYSTSDPIYFVLIFLKVLIIQLLSFTGMVFSQKHFHFGA